MFLFLAALVAFPPPVRDLDSLVRASGDAWKVPGLAVVIVHEDRVIYLKGFGVRKLGEPALVTPDTVFPLASCTKPFTALALAMLVDDGKLAWDDPVRKHVPFFHLKDRCADEMATLRDLLCHRTGLGRHDLLWYRSPWPVEERIRRLALLDLDAGFRAAFQYQPVAFAAAGAAAGRADGTSWAEVIERRVLKPLGMRSSAAVFPAEATDLASPHRRVPGGTAAVIDRYPEAQADPAGSLHTTARDLAAFLRLQLEGGTLGGHRLVSARQLAETHQTQMAIPRGGIARLLNPESVQLGYGLGWVVQDYRGRLLILHGGSIDGFRAQITLVPEARLGIALLNNLDGTYCNLALTNRLIDRFLELEPRDWDGYYLGIEKRDAETDREESRKRRADRSAKPPLPRAAYAGDYEDGAYGTCRIRVAGEQLTMSWGSLTSPLEYVRGQTFLADQPPLHDASFVFDTDARGNVTAVEALGRTFRRVGR